MRKAASMLELVIAIVVMGIAVMSLPLILTQSQNANAVALQQEVILATKTKLGYILSYEWDANSYDANASVSRVLDTNGSTSANLAFYTTTTHRTGHVIADNRRRLRDNMAAPTTDGGANWGNVALNDIDDFDAKSESTTIVAADMDYIFNLELNSTVQYISDAPNVGTPYNNSQDINFSFNAASAPANPTNIKMITVRTRDTSNNVNVLLRSFASNIGESTFAKRAW